MKRVTGPAAALFAVLMVAAVAVESSFGALPNGAYPVARDTTRLFESADACIACHNGLATPSGEDVSIGTEWRATMMANSARDPYWQASVRREVLERPAHTKEIEDGCATCHMPMARTEAHAAGARGEVFASLSAERGERAARLAADGVSCTLCHQVADAGLGQPSSFTGGYVIDVSQPWSTRSVFGPYVIDSGRATIMHSASEFKPTQGLHIRKSEMCATCHTLFTDALDASGKVVGRLPEQVPYQEWRHSSFVERKSCQTCHMPAVVDSTPISGVWGQKRAGLARHDFLGGNFFVLDMLNRYRDELGVEATSDELARSVRRTTEHLRTSAARVTVRDAGVANGQLRARVRVENLGGHKLPTAYPSRRAWLHVTVRAANGTVVFESGRVRDDGSIEGNDNDANAATYEPHHREIRSASAVQVYESVMVDAENRVTTVLLSGVRYAKDNRVLPDGFDKHTASPDVAVHGDAAGDADFIGGSDEVQYAVDVSRAQGPFAITAELRFQPIGFRWATNLSDRQAPEISRFSSYYRAMASASSVSIARDSVRTP